MKLRRDAKSLKGKALASLRRGLASFNSFEEDGRATSVLLHFQHCCEMLVKALLVQKRVNVFDKKTQISEGFARCLNLASAHGITASEAGLMRAIDSLRDAEQHWLIVVSEDLLYLHARSLVSVIDDILKRSFCDSLAATLPIRVLPVSTTPVTDFDLMIDNEYSQISELLKPGRRQVDQARGRIRALLALESHVADDVSVSEKDIDRIEVALRAKTAIDEVFPRLRSITTTTAGIGGYEFKVHFTKKEGAPVKFVAADDSAGAAAVREVDLQKKYHISPTIFAEKLGLSLPKTKALRDFALIDADANLMHIFNFGSQRHARFSDSALTKAKKTLAATCIEDIWELQATLR
jgi:hypothetical protein